MNVIFLDYDGVVNTPMWDKNGERCLYNSPFDNKVNNFQSVQWVSEFCQKYEYSIVVTSTWRLHSNYKECLINGGLREGIEILGKTPRTGIREQEIKAYLLEHQEVDKFLIFDDEDCMDDLSDHLVQCDGNVGFCLKDFCKAEKIIDDFK